MQERAFKLRIITTPLPPGVHGMSAKDGDDRFIVLINEDDDPDTQQEAFIHKMLHIWHGDHDRENVDVQQLEAERRAETRRELLRQQGRGQRILDAPEKTETTGPQ